LDSTVRRRGIFLRRLTDSDLGLFAACRPHVASKQRAININAPIAEAILPRDARRQGEATIATRYCRNGVIVERPLRLTEKNWRLGGPKIEGDRFGILKAGDWFLAEYEVSIDRKISLIWQAVSNADQPALWKQIDEMFGSKLVNGMIHLSETHPDYDLLDIVMFVESGGDNQIADITPPPREAPRIVPSEVPVIQDNIDRPPPLFPQKAEPAERKTKTTRERIREPHILAEMIQTASQLSAGVQLEFFEVVARLAEELRAVLRAAKLIREIPFDHKAFWPLMRGKSVASIDGGMANIQTLGSAPIAIRVGVFHVTPGVEGDEREDFRVVTQLVDELYAEAPAGVYAGWFRDRSALRDAARIATETAAAVAVLEQEPKPKFLLLHGALVNPASRYSDETADHGQIIAEWPAFNPSALRMLLPNEKALPEGQNAKFIPVYRRQLQELWESDVAICGVVERPGATTSVTRELVLALPDDAIATHISLPPSQWKREFLTAAETFGITDRLLMHCVLFENETTVPIAVDRNEEHKAPAHWRSVIRTFPKPYVAFMLPSDRAPPLRWEIFDRGLEQFEEFASLLLHSSKLLPGYAFPVGLDIVDKFAKVPNWMGKPISARLAAEVLRRAMESGDASVSNAVRKLLTSSRREWFLRPKA